MRRSTLGLLAAAAISAGMLSASTARAGEITINFDFTSTTISAFGGALTIPPDGSITAASATVTVQGAGIVTPSGGPLTLEDLSLSATVDGNPILGANITGFVIANQLNTPAFGTLNSNLATATLFPPLFLDVSVSIDCNGFLCGAIGFTQPISLNGTQTINNSLSLLVSGLSVNGSAMVSGTLSLSFNGGITATIMLVGNEVSRTFDLPEPGWLASMAGGTAGLVGLLLLRRRRS